MRGIASDQSISPNSMGVLVDSARHGGECVSGFVAGGAMKDFLLREDGVTATEYALLASVVAIAIIFGVLIAGQNLQSLYLQVVGCVENAARNHSAC